MTEGPALVESAWRRDGAGQPPAEVLFACVAEALDDAGLRKADVDVSVVASRDLYDACSMSNGQLMPAAAGWQAHNATRLETDFGAALVLADSILRRGDAEVVLVSAVHQPQVADAGGQSFDALVSNLAAEPLYERGVGLTAATTLALHASRAVATGATSARALAETAADEITLGAEGKRAVRSGATVGDDVLGSAVVAWPLTELMLPAQTSGAVAMVLTTPERARAMGGARAHFLAHGMAAIGSLSAGDWLADPADVARRAAAQAYRRAGLIEPAQELDVAEITAASPALCGPLREALGLGGLADERISPSGGVRSSFAGVANGGFRLLEAIEWLERNDGKRALVHSADTLAGLLSATTTVTLVERP